jgi:hypothetical protein
MLNNLTKHAFISQSLSKNQEKAALLQPFDYQCVRKGAIFRRDNWHFSMG